MIEEGLLYLLRNTATIQAIVGTRSFWVVLPQGTDLPAISVSRVTTERWAHHGGSSGVARALFQVSCWGRTSLEAKQLAAEVRKAFHGVSGTYATRKIFLALVVDEKDLFDPDQAEPVYHCPVDILVTYPES